MRPASADGLWQRRRQLDRRIFAELALPAPDNQRILIIRPGAIGDTFLAVPALRGLHTRFPLARRVLIGNPAAGEVLALARIVHQVVDFDSPAIACLFQPNSAESGQALNGPWTAIVAWLSDSSGVLRNNLRSLGSEKVLVAASQPTGPVRRHVSDYLLATLAPLGVDPASPVAAEGRVLPIEAGAASSRTPVPVLAVHPGSGSATKNWPAARFAHVAEIMVLRGWTAELICGPADDQACSLVRAECRAKLGALEGAPLVNVARRLQDCAAYLGNDSGLSHLAAFLGIPCVAMFGPSDPERWAPRGPKARVLPFETDPVDVAQTLAALATRAS